MITKKKKRKRKLDCKLKLKRNPDACRQSTNGTQILSQSCEDTMWWGRERKEHNTQKQKMTSKWNR